MEFVLKVRPRGIVCNRHFTFPQSPPRDISDVNNMNFISVASLFVIMVWLINYAPDNLVADTTVSASDE